MLQGREDEPIFIYDLDAQLALAKHGTRKRILTDHYYTAQIDLKLVGLGTPILITKRPADGFFV